MKIKYDKLSNLVEKTKSSINNSSTYYSNKVKAQQFNLNKPDLNKFKIKFNYKDYTLANLKKMAQQNKKLFYTKLAIVVVVLLYIIGLISVSVAVYKYDNHSNLVRKLLYIYPLPAATVNYRPILVSTVYKQIGYVEKYTKQSCQADSKTCQQANAYSSIRDRAVEQQVENRLISNQAKKFNIQVTDKDVDAAYKQVIGNNGGDKEVSKVLSSLYGMTIPEFKDLLRSQLLKDKIDQKEIQRVDVSHILVADEVKANSVIADINSGKISFADAAKKYSEDSNSKDKSGSLGVIARGIMPPEFDDVAFNKAEVGKVYPTPVKTDFGFHIILVNKKTGTIKQSFQDWLTSIEKKAKIHKFLN